jgi:hypothetical protein
MDCAIFTQIREISGLAGTRPGANRVYATFNDTALEARSVCPLYRRPVNRRCRHRARPLSTTDGVDRFQLKIHAPSVSIETVPGEDHRLTDAIPYNA